MKPAELLSRGTLEKVAVYRERFAAAQPFRWVVIDDFFAPEPLRWMLEDFPPFREEKAMNEMGRVGVKAVFDDLSAISERYARIGEGIANPGFRDYVSVLTGIEGLLHDDAMYGGGTHENLDGAELDPHVDFNFDERLGWHRRLNLLAFLNPEWDASWGGCVELHSAPRDPAANRIVSFAPVLNRCVLFETNEHSWHGFSRIELPEDKKHLSRRSLTVYLYSADRPAEEVAPSHATFYVQRPLPEHLRPGHTLSQRDVVEIQRHVHKRDAFLAFYQEKELADSARYQRLLDYHRAVARAVRLPLRGYVEQRGEARGYWPDGWLERELRFSVAAERPVCGGEITGLAPEGLPFPCEVAVEGPAERVSASLEGPGPFALALPETLAPGAFGSFRVTASAALPPAGGDERERSVALLRVAFEHGPAAATPAGPADAGALARLRDYHVALHAFLRLPLQGYVRQEPPAEGYFGDGWLAATCRFTVVAERPVRGVALSAVAPPDLPFPAAVRFEGAGAEAEIAVEEPGAFGLSLDAALDAGERGDFEIRCPPFVPPRGSADERPRSIHLVRVVFEHDR